MFVHDYQLCKRAGRRLSMKFSSQRLQYLDKEACGREYASAYETLRTFSGVLEDVPTERVQGPQVLLTNIGATGAPGTSVQLFVDGL